MSTTVAQILKAKPDSGRTIYTVTKADFVYDAIKLMAEKGIGALLVMDGDDIAWASLPNETTRARSCCRIVRRRPPASTKS